MEPKFFGIGLSATMALHLGIVALVVFSPSWNPKPAGCVNECDPTDPTCMPKKPLLAPTDYEMIEAAIAYKKKEAPKQPQKKKSRKKAPTKVGVSRDADQKADKTEKKKEDIPDWRDFKRDDEETDDDDLEPGEAPPDVGGAWDGEEFGWADENKGHPYMREIVKQVHFEVPTLEKGQGFAIACVRLAANGTIIETQLREPSGISNIDRAAEETLKHLAKARENEKDVEPVPKELLAITNKWLCFKLGL